MFLLCVIRLQFKQLKTPEAHSFFVNFESTLHTPQKIFEKTQVSSVYSFAAENSPQSTHYLLLFELGLLKTSVPSCLRN